MTFPSLLLLGDSKKARAGHDQQESGTPKTPKTPMSAKFGLKRSNAVHNVDKYVSEKRGLERSNAVRRPKEPQMECTLERSNAIRGEQHAYMSAKEKRGLERSNAFRKAMENPAPCGLQRSNAVHHFHNDYVPPGQPAKEKRVYHVSGPITNAQDQYFGKFNDESESDSE